MKVKIMYSNDKEPVSYNEIESAIIWNEKEFNTLELKHQGKHITTINLTKTDWVKIKEKE